MDQDRDQDRTSDSPAGRGRKLDVQTVGRFAEPLLVELRTLASRSGCHYLCYLLDMAAMEASDLATARPPSPIAAPSVPIHRTPDPDEIARLVLELEG